MQSPAASEARRVSARAFHSAKHKTTVTTEKAPRSAGVARVLQCVEPTCFRVDNTTSASRASISSTVDVLSSSRPASVLI